MRSARLLSINKLTAAVGLSVYVCMCGAVNVIRLRCSGRPRTEESLHTLAGASSSIWFCSARLLYIYWPLLYPPAYMYAGSSIFSSSSFPRDACCVLYRCACTYSRETTTSAREGVGVLCFLRTD